MNPLAVEGHLRDVLIAWAVIVLLALVAGRVAARLGQPAVVGEIAAGLVVGPSLLGALLPDAMTLVFPSSIQQSLQVLAKVGVLLLMFQVGMEFDFGHLRTSSRTVLAVASAGMIVPVLGALAVAPWLTARFAEGVHSLGFVLFTCIALSITALPVMGRILLEMRLTRTRVGAIAITAAGVDDAVGWLVLAAATALVTARFHWSGVALQVLGLAVFGALVLRVVGPLLMRWWRRSESPATTGRGQADGSELAGDCRDMGKPAGFPASSGLPPSLGPPSGAPLRSASGTAPIQDRVGPPAGMTGTFLAALLTVLMLACVATNALGVFSIFGAFLLGVSLHAERSLVDSWRTTIMPFVAVALVPIFFTNTGLRTRVGALDGEAWLGLAVLLLIAVAGKLGACYVAARWTGLPKREAACVGALMNTRGLMGLVAINAGADLGLLPPRMFTMLVLVALLTTAMTGPLLRLWLDDAARGTTPVVSEAA